MKTKCQKCGTIIEIDESEYPKGTEQTIECPLCQNEITFSVNDDKNHPNSVPHIPPVDKGHKRVECRKVKEGLSSDLMTDSQRGDKRNHSIPTGVEGNDVLSTEQTVMKKKGWVYRLAYNVGYYHKYIKKVIVILGILLICIFVGKYAWHSQSQPPHFVESDSTGESVNNTAIEEAKSESDYIISFITSMYEEKKYENYQFLNSHCTQHLLAVLAEAYDYECNENPCYATWLFRTYSQDEKSSTENENRVLSVHEIAEHWFEVEFYDSGWKGIKRINAYYKDNDVVMDNVETVYDEAIEDLEKIQEATDSTETSTNAEGYVTLLSERKLTEEDIRDLSPEQLELLRNMIYAWHGYKFSREDLLSFFSKYSWYHPTIIDASSVYGNLTEIEKYNLEFIKTHE